MAAADPAVAAGPSARNWPVGLPDLRAAKERQRLKLYAALAAIDVGCLAMAFVAANAVRFGDPLAPPGLVGAWISATLFVPLAFAGKAYSIEALHSPLTSATRAVRALLVTTAALLALFFALKTTGEMSRAVLALGLALAGAALALARYAFGRAVGQRLGWQFVREVLILDGVLVRPRRGQIVIVADRSGISPSINDPDAHDRLGRFLARCDRVVLACEPARRTLWGAALRGAGVPVEVLTPELDYLGALALRRAGGQSCVLIAPGPLTLRERILKRALDLGIALAALALLAPLFGLVALAIKLDSRGPVFFRQPRIGRSNRRFDVLKFRSMRTANLDAEGSRSTGRDDDRVTRVGRVLRRTSLDELPQLVNVVRGEMSLVGPRPHALGSTAEDRLFWDIDRRYWQRGSVKPGITGLAQVRGYRGATERTDDLTRRLQADLEYVSNWSIWTDLVIIARTLRVLVHPNAY
ncbi:sugar transferase [Tsuneonella sp. SYSU-LHT278]|uniref:sugar transferase n=1 Tax=Tsuneonella sediminis TaxID=3416089 RepID=UPI003F7A2005